MTSPYGQPHDTDTGTPTWMNHANCAGIDPALFFPKRGGDSETPKAVCRACTVRLACLDYALTNGEKHGVWGGTSDRERRRIRSQRARAQLRVSVTA